MRGLFCVILLFAQHKIKLFIAYDFIKYAITIDFFSLTNLGIKF